MFLSTCTKKQLGGGQRTKDRQIDQVVGGTLKGSLIEGRELSVLVVASQLMSHTCVTAPSPGDMLRVSRGHRFPGTEGRCWGLEVQSLSPSVQG